MKKAAILGPRTAGLIDAPEPQPKEDWVVVKGVQRAMPGVQVTPQRQKITPQDENFLMPDITSTQAESDIGG